jgi:HPt (histidine-containing phosphotransfer) domain-containing protein
MALNIPGVDEAAFNDLFDGDEDTYAAVLKSFVNNTPAVLAKLASVTAENLKTYADTVHGLKGACANVCAEDARKKALDLELKAKAGDLAFCQANNAAFLKNVEDLMPKLQTWLKAHP